ncbi:EF-hand calcium-binding domain-containing protein 6-like isoform X2 [Amia ocellicauda]|uniref:EF-hand calcium-binding domain-containing protein 6-like isoform X2 n=1 Tax=Amia ocellicauda TaxID=2972642 RepID=UPI003464B0CD
MPGSIVSTSLPNICKSPLNATLNVQGKNNLAAPEKRQGESAWNGRNTWNCGSVVLRARTAGAPVAAGLESCEKNLRANTAIGHLSTELWSRKHPSLHEIIVLITEKLRSHLHSVHQLFRANDPKGEGRVSKEGLNRILWSLCGYLSPQQVNSLLNKLGLAGHASVSFDDFTDCFPLKKKKKNEWFTPTVAKQLEDLENKKKPIDSQSRGMDSQDTERIWTLIKEKFKKSDFLIEKCLPPSCLGPSGTISVEQLRQFLDNIGFLINEEELDRLWARISKNSAQHTNTDSLIKQLGIIPQGPVRSHSPQSSNTVQQRRIATGTHPGFEEIVTVLKTKLSESCLALLHAFAKHDQHKTGLVPRTVFRQALAQFNIPMGAIDLEHLLARLALRSKDGMVNYERFLEKLTSRSSLSMFNNTVEHGMAGDCTGSGGCSEGLMASKAETRLLELCHRLLLRLIAAFRKADPSGDGSVRLEQFKEIVEKTFQVQLTDEQLRSLAGIVGDPETRLISYNKFLLLFQDRPSTSELKEEVERCSSLIHVRYDRLRYNESFRADWARFSHAQKIRPLQELRAIVHGLLQERFRLFCKVFISVCNNDECTADKEKLDSILQKMNVILLPLELGKLWYSLPISYPVEAISLRKFVLYFSKLKKMKDLGPREENIVTLTQIKLRNHIVKQWRPIKSILRANDPMGSGKVPLRVIYALFLTLKFNVAPAEIDRLSLAFDLDKDGYFHYIPFLRFYVEGKKKKVILQCV